ncbi:hypothetical protein JTB14_001031 [Gonioctena quinquepunctata]|nr:hypothetical protein JTB14_001031 [Gonioctena quinquepunctata]
MESRVLKFLLKTNSDGDFPDTGCFVFRYVSKERDNSVDRDSDTEDAEVFIEPPESHVLTDEDSAVEDEGGLADNLSSRQLTAGAEIRFTNSRRVGGIADDLNSDLHNEISAGTSSNGYLMEENIGNMSTSDTKKTNKTELKLHKVPAYPKYCDDPDLLFTEHYFPKDNYDMYKYLTHCELFELFFTDELLQVISQQTTNYALFQNCPDPQVSVKELRVYIAILLVSGYNELPSKCSYWETSRDMRNDLVYEAMRRDRFLQICRFIHFADNTAVDPDDKMYKLRPSTDYLKNKFLEHFVPEPNLSYDESMIRYYGRHGCKQFIHGKPIRFGYKIWCLNKPFGYLVNFEIYQGKNPRAKNDYELYFGKCAAPLVQMLQDVRNIKKSFQFNIFLDNLFTEPNILHVLKQNGYGVTGTIRDNR